MERATSSGYSAGAPEALALRRGPASAVRAALCAARRRTLALADDYAAALGRERPQVPYAAELNPPLWELGHVAWFQEWWIARNPARAEGVRCDPGVPRAASILADSDARYDSSQVAHRTRWELPLPDADGTRDYLARTFEGTLALLDVLPEDAGDDALYFYRLAAFHEQMHAEAACYMAQLLGIAVSEPLVRPLRGGHAELRLPAQCFRLGSTSSAFAFDNELQAHEVAVGPLAIDAEAVSWERYLPFVEAGGYDDPRWWSEAGAAWLSRERRRAPVRLRRAGGGWESWRNGRWSALQPAEAAMHLSAHEAEAWCRWAGRRLPTEAEWECAALTLPGFAWGHAWEWTASTFAPYPGFVAHPYRDYSAPWFGTRRVLRGACPATDAALAHARYRNYFEPHRWDVFAGFRSCRDL